MIPLRIYLLNILKTRTTKRRGGHVTKNVVFGLEASALPGSLLEMQDLEPLHPRPTKPEPASQQNPRMTICTHFSLQNNGWWVLLLDKNAKNYQWLPRNQTREGSSCIAILTSGSLTRSFPPSVPSTSAWVGKECSLYKWPSFKALTKHSPTKFPPLPYPPTPFSMRVPSWMGAICPDLSCWWPTSMPCHTQWQCHRPFEVLCYPGQVRPMDEIQGYTYQKLI